MEGMNTICLANTGSGLCSSPQRGDILVENITMKQNRPGGAECGIHQLEGWVSSAPPERSNFVGDCFLPLYGSAGAKCKIQYRVVLYPHPNRVVYE